MRTQAFGLAPTTTWPGYPFNFLELFGREGGLERLWSVLACSSNQSGLTLCDRLHTLFFLDGGVREFSS